MFSVILCASAASLWVRGHWIGDVVDWNQERRAKGEILYEWTHTSLRSAAGGLRFDRRRTTTTGDPTTTLIEARLEKGLGLHWTTERTPLYPYERIDGPPPDFRRLGFVWDWNKRTYSDWGNRREVYSGYFVVVPYWALVLLSSLLPARWALARRRRRGRGFDVSVPA